MLKNLFLLLFLTEISIASEFSTEKWMENLSSNIKNLKINQLFLPGSHDSATYTLEHQFGKNQNISNKLNALKIVGVGYFITNIAYKWSKAQGVSIYQQLQKGVRYLDLRVIYRDSKKSFYTVHGLYGPSLDEVLKQIDMFLKTNTKEILVIQIGDLKYMPNKVLDHKNLINILKTKFQGKIVPKNEVKNLTVGDIWDKKYQIVFIYNDPSNISRELIQNDAFINDTSLIEDYWANATDKDALKSALDKNLKEHYGRKFLYVIQSQLTPSGDTIKSGLNPFSKIKSLEDMANIVNPSLKNWLSNWSKYKGSIILLDFIDESNCQSIISHNKS